MHLLWRHDYYGRWWPNTAQVKAQGLEMLPVGLAYLADAALRLQLPLAAVVLALHVARFRSALFRSERSALAAAVAVPYLGYVALAGGDFMDQFRFVVPVLPPLLFVLGGAMEDLRLRAAPNGPAVPRSRAGVAAIAVFLALWVGLNAAESRRSNRSWHENNQDSVGLLRDLARDWSAVGRTMRAVSLPSDSIAVTAAGCIPYHSGLYTIDQLGLVAPDLTPYARRDHLRPGHGRLLRGDALMAMRPQFVAGGPVVAATPDAARLSAWIDDSGQEVFQREYVAVGLVAEHAEGRRYFLVAARKDVGARLGHREGGPPDSRTPPVP
jgi:hypothetical protein